MVTQIQKSALRIFLTIPLIFAFLAVILVLSSTPLRRGVLIFYNMLSAFIVSTAIILLTSDVISKKAHDSKLIGIVYGLVLLVIGSIAFSLPNWLYLSDCTIVQCLLVPVGWICFYGWPIAAFCGILFSGTCEKEHVKKYSSKSGFKSSKPRP